MNLHDAIDAAYEDDQVEDLNRLLNDLLGDHETDMISMLSLARRAARDQLTDDVATGDAGPRMTPDQVESGYTRAVMLGVFLTLRGLQRQQART